VLRGEECSRRFTRGGDGRLQAGDVERMMPGDIDVVSPSHGDIHEVSNGIPDRPSISIHVYGANIGAVERNVFDIETGRPKSFVSGYHNASVPNLWYRG
jgi:predicted metal-dependent enzyme (double-stranded beta helix superfamily)